jgi:hypothetical protein
MHGSGDLALVLTVSTSAGPIPPQTHGAAECGAAWQQRQGIAPWRRFNVPREA